MRRGTNRLVVRSAVAVLGLLLLGAGQPQPAAVSHTPVGEDCVALDPTTVAAANSGGDWRVVAGAQSLLDYGPDSEAAERAANVIQHYHFTRQCFVRRPNAAMMYWKNGVAVPPGNMPGQDCLALAPANVQAIYSAARWKVMDGKDWLLDFGQDRGAAEEAVSIIRTYDLNRECFIARPHVAMQYWLAE